MYSVLARCFEGAFMGREKGKEVFTSDLNRVGEKEKLMLRHSLVVML